MATLPQNETGHEPYFLARLNKYAPWQVAVALFAIQVVMFLVGVGIDQIVGGTASYGFLGGMGLFAGLILLDAISVGITTGRAIFWAVVVTIGTIFGALPYAYARRDALGAR